MNRRDFIKAIGVGAAAVTFGPALAATTVDAIAPVASEGWGAASLAVGDIFTVAGVYATNPITGYETWHLQQFVITADTGGDEVSISPAVTQLGRVISRSHISPMVADFTGLTT